MIELRHSLASYMAFHADIKVHPWQKELVEHFLRGGKVTLDQRSYRRQRLAVDLATEEIAGYTHVRYGTAVYWMSDDGVATISDPEQLKKINDWMNDQLERSFSVPVRESSGSLTFDEVSRINKKMRRHVSNAELAMRPISNLPWYRRFEKRERR